MPALTLVAVLLAGLLLALADDEHPARRTSVAARAAIVLVAVAVIAGLAVELRSANLAAAARGAPDAPDALETLERAQRLSLDETTPEIDRARLLLFLRREREAAVVADAIVRREPENAFAWELVRLANDDGDPTRAREAQERLGRLVRRAP
jgi:hypothetical protein